MRALFFVHTSQARGMRRLHPGVLNRYRRRCSCPWRMRVPDSGTDATTAPSQNLVVTALAHEHAGPCGTLG